MSLNRLLLRRTIVGMLNNGEEAPYPTLAARNVYDSKVDSLDTKDGENQHIISIYTDKDQGFCYHDTDSNDRVIEVIIEFMIFSTDKDGSGIPTTDFQLEIQLDMIEDQIKNSIKNLANPFTVIFQEMVTKVENWNSNRIAVDSSGHKFAARQIQFMATVRDDDEFPVTPLSHEDNVTRIIGKFEKLNQNGNLSLTLNWLKKQIITPDDGFDNIGNIDITSNGVEGSIES